MLTAFTPSDVSSEPLGLQLRAAAAAVQVAPGRRRLLSLAVGIVTVIVATAYTQVALNAWNQPFFDAIERKDMPEFRHQLGVFFMLASILLVLNVGQTGLNQMIRLSLRDLATRDLISEWMTDRRAARIGRAGAIGINPDQRIHSDAAHLADLTTDLGVGLIQASILLLSFIGVLWVLSSGITFDIAGRETAIPGYMVWAALLYALSGSWLSWRAGRPLMRLEEARYSREADLRVALVQGAAQADGIALASGEPDERRRLEVALDAVLAVLRRTVFARVRLTWVTAGYGWVALVVPIIVAAPGYFGGRLSFGELMMVVGAFNQVQQALRWFVDNTGAIADWRATLARVTTFRRALGTLDRSLPTGETIRRALHPQGNLAFKDLVVRTAHGSLTFDEPSLELAPGERVLVLGRPGAGKSTLFLAVAGLWTLGGGRIALPPPSETVFLPKRPFLPSGTLREVLSYALPASDDRALAAALVRVGLGRLVDSLDRPDRWDEELSVPEMERVAYARVLLARPKWLICDEGLDPLGEDNRALMLEILNNDLSETAVLDIANRSVPEGFYDRCVRLIAQPTETAAARAAGQQLMA
jgi:putative ATP-binding cassette transporter